MHTHPRTVNCFTSRGIFIDIFLHDDEGIPPHLPNHPYRIDLTRIGFPVRLRVTERGNQLHTELRTNIDEKGVENGREPLTLSEEFRTFVPIGNFAPSSNGKTADSGSAYRGSNPCGAAGRAGGAANSEFRYPISEFVVHMALSSNGLGRGPLKAEIRVRFPLRLHENQAPHRAGPFAFRAGIPGGMARPYLQACTGPAACSFRHSAKRLTPSASNWIREQSFAKGDSRKSLCMSSSVR